MSTYTQLYPWTLKHPVVRDLTLRTQLAYVELLADVATHPVCISEKWIKRLIRKNHRDALISAGLIIRNDDDTYTVVQPTGMYAPLGGEDQ
ncbi:hypothetical protein [Gordonia sp. SND2]|uniref:hypothetical protein n=1 Tax=Gordonia sp. SND2 TaxID=3388659 RepID=UPI00398AA0AC